MTLMYLSRDVWREYGDGAMAGASKEQRFRFPVSVGDKIGFNYEELERHPAVIGEDKWPGWAIQIRILVYKKKGSVLLRIGGLTGEVLVPTPKSLKKIRRLARAAAV